MQHRPYLSSFGRNRGRSLSAHQQSLVDALLPTLSPPIVRGEGEAEALQQWAQALREEGYTSLALEIGFGGGEHLLAQAAHHPETLFIGCEPYLNGVAKCLVGIDAQKLRNVRLFMGDARTLIEALPDASLDSVFILFPDPWPKVRHHKRRLINHELLKMLARIHRSSGRLLIATDHVDYSLWILNIIGNNIYYEWTASNQSDWKTPPDDWTQTKYQRKTTAEGREPLFFECRRK